MLKKIDRDLYDWVEWNTRLLENSGLGYRPRTTESLMMEYGCAASSNPPGPRVPLLKATLAHIRRMDRVLDVLPADLMKLVQQHYTERSTGKTRGLYRQLDRLHFTIQGALLMARQ
jgi:hypothetical protein